LSSLPLASGGGVIGVMNIELMNIEHRTFR